MKVKKVIRKIAVLGIGATMMGATLLGATATDLGAYPAPFIQDGQFNGLMVVGDDAAPADIIGVTDIAIALQFSSTTTKTVSTGTAGEVTVEGDAVKFERSGDVLEINETLGGAVETFDSADAEGLKSFTVSNSKGTTDVNQYLRFKWGTGADENVDARVVYDKDDQDRVGDFLLFPDGENAFRYELEFEESFETDIETDRTLQDLEDETLHMLGEDFAVSRATLSTSGKLTLELMGGAVHDTLEEGETRTYTIDGKDYEVTVLIITDTSPFRTKFKVNGEVTNEMSEGDTEVLTDGTNLGIRELLPNEAGETAGGDLVEFYLGANKVKFTDTLTGETTTDGTVEINEENIEDAEVNIVFTNTSDEVRIQKITYDLDTDGASGDQPYLTAGEGLREWLDEPEGLLSSSWDVKYEGLSDPGVSMVELKSRGDDEYRLSFESIQGVEYTIPLFYASSATNVAFGDDSDRFICQQTETAVAMTWANFSIDKNDQFVLAHNGGTDQGVVRIMELDSIDTSNDQVQLTDAGTGAQVIGTYTENAAIAGCSESGNGTFNVGGYTFDFLACYNSTSSMGDKKSRLLVDIDDDGTLGGLAENITINGGGILRLVNCSQQSYAGLNYPTASDSLGTAAVVQVITESDNFDESPGSYENVPVVVSATTGPELDLDVSNTASAVLSMKSHEDNNDLTSGMTRYGVYFEEMNENNDPDSLEVKYPLGQLLPQAFVVFEGATVKEGGAGSVTYEVPNRIEIGAALLASQVSDATAANIISVGGSCVNEVTAELLGLPYPSCGEASGLAEGEGLIKLVENGGNVAVLVAGWDAEDTTRATRVLSDYGTWQDANKLAGSEVKVTGTSLTNYDVSPVVAEAPAEEQV